MQDDKIKTPFRLLNKKTKIAINGQINKIQLQATNKTVIRINSRADTLSI